MSEENQTLWFIVDAFERQIHETWHLQQGTNKWLTPEQEQKRPGKPSDDCSIKNMEKQPAEMTGKLRALHFT